jgi:ribosomal protein S12 methylthiotransferase
MTGYKLGIASCCDGPMNTTRAERLIANAESYGFCTTPKLEEADAVVVVTCAFLNFGKYGTLRIFDEVFRKARKNIPVVAYGCMVDRYPEEIRRALPEVKDFFHTEQPAAPLERLAGLFGTEKGEFSLLKRDILGFEGEKSSAYFVISDGCNNKCSYCPLPGYRGAYRSRPMEELLEEAKIITGQGVERLVISGLETTGYGKDRSDGSSLTKLLSRLPRWRALRTCICCWQIPKGLMIH